MLRVPFALQREAAVLLEETDIQDRRAASPGSWSQGAKGTARWQPRAVGHHQDKDVPAFSSRKPIVAAHNLC
jgi:hypothetical protein